MEYSERIFGAESLRMPNGGKGKVCAEQVKTRKILLFFA